VPANDPNDRRIVDMAACNSCHTKLSWHGGNRVDINYCVMCHNDQQKYGWPEAEPTATGYTGETRKIYGMSVGDMTALVHRIHMGEHLSKDGYAFSDINPFDAQFPQDLRNCTKCHTAAVASTPQGDNWKNNPSRLACGACHDAVNFITGDGHPGLGGIRTDDSKCSTCHPAAEITLYHSAVAPGNPAFATGAYTNGSALASNLNNLPVGAIKVTYDLKSVTLDATGHPIFTFRFLQNGARADFNTFGAGKTEMWDNFVGSPSAYLTFAVPQDGNLTPADYNASASVYIKKVWNGTATGSGAGTLSAPDANGYYTLTMTGVALPVNATMITGGLGYTYNKNSQPLTQTNVPAPTWDPTSTRYVYDPVTMLGGLSVPAPNVFKTVSGTLPASFGAQTARRTIVDSKKCNACHATLGVFTDSAYHAGERNNAESCSFCHNPNKTSSGWSANASTFIHGIHGASKRSVPFTWQATSATDTFANLTWPGAEHATNLNNCEACHVPGSYDFSNSTNADAVPNMLFTTVGTGKYNGASTTAYTLSPYVVKDNVTDYGVVFSYNAGTGVTVAAAPTTLVSSPITAACASCHDNGIAIAHMTGNGGAFYEARATALTKVEQCLVCHGTGRTADIKAVHMNF
jgi:OmcA/MtrC family decaheme c-type cytochrome